MSDGNVRIFIEDVMITLGRRRKQDNYHWELFDHLPQIPDLAPSAFHLCKTQGISEKWLESYDMSKETGLTVRRRVMRLGMQKQYKASQIHAGTTKLVWDCFKVLLKLGSQTSLILAWGEFSWLEKLFQYHKGFQLN